MAKDAPELLREILISAIENVGKAPKEVAGGGSKSKGQRRGLKSLALGAGAAALAPVALRKLEKGIDLDSLGGLGGGLGEKLRDILEEAGVSDSDSGEVDGGGVGIGQGRRMPVQQSVDVGAPIEVVYNQWTQYEQWPKFMHRVTRVTQEDECTVSFATKIWGKTKEFTAKIETQRPDERVKWRATQGMNHVGVVTFHELGPHLTRVLLGLDIEPAGPLEKAARGLRHIKRAARGDLHRFKAFVEMSERETGAWRGVIENGEVKKKHPASYDKQHEYAEAEDVLSQDGEQKAEKPRQNGGRRRAAAGASSSRRATGSTGTRARGRSSGSSGTRSRSHTSRGRSS